ncbi:MAG: hypothetical protein HQ474_04760 [Flammeovirgaceae bacterium]|nr:hypothetical protein [Flammeovirgaceae bacterium]|tara:strand:+ start:3080 stop:3448 length:369 start_codon:yes stop_codon:yes gene_type:complete
MKIESGYYKIKLKGRSLDDQYHYLRVFYKNKIKYLQMSHGIPQEAENYEEGLLNSYELIKRITHHRPIEVRHATITLSWKDEDGDPFQLKVRNIHALQRVFELFPRLAKAVHGDTSSFKAQT